MCKERRNYITGIHNETVQNARSYSYKQHILVCKHDWTNKSIMITFAERLSTSVPICVLEREKTYVKHIHL